MKNRDLLMEALPPVLGALLLAGVVHILAIFAMPSLSHSDAWTRLAATGQANRFMLLAREDDDAPPLPFEDPRTFISICRFDISSGPVRVQANFTGDGLVVTSFHDRYGSAFYGLTDRGGLRGRLDALIVSQAQLEELEANAPDDEPAQELRLASPTMEGFVIARSVIVDATDAQAAKARLTGFSCTQSASR